MKLVRLKTENNGFFKSSFGNEMFFKPNSKMALLNLTFETEFEIFQVDSRNSAVTVFTDSDDTNTEVTTDLEERVYTRSEIDEFYNDLKNTLNACISNYPSSNGPGSQFDIRYFGGNRQIEYRYSPFLNPLFLPNQGNLMSLDNELIDVVTTANKTVIKTKGAAVENRDNNIITGVGKMCSGNGRLIARIHNLLPNGQSSDFQNNGFGLGLSKTPLTEIIVPGEDIPRANTDFEVRVNRPGENYVFISEGALVETDSGVAPEVVTGGELYDHDVMFFEIVGNVLSGGVYITYDGSPSKNTFFTYVMDDGEEFYPYLYIRGTFGFCSVDMFNYTPDPWVNQPGGGQDDDEPPYWDLTGLDSPGNIHNAETNGVGETVTSGTIFSGVAPNDFVVPDPANWLLKKNVQIDLSASVWNFLGYGLANSNWESGRDDIESKIVPIGLNIARDCWSFWVPRNEPVVQLSDNFMIESMSINLDSYDASDFVYGNVVTPPRPEAEKKGRRKNILCTIPVNDNSNGLVQYEANNLIYIDINNAETLNVRNLNFRILNKDFKEIRQSGESAVMTILIDG